MNSISFYKALLMKEIDEELKGGQKKLDVAEPKGKITGADFAALRKKKDVKEAGFAGMAEDDDQIRPDLKSAYDQGYKAGYAKCKYDMSGEFPAIFESQDKVDMEKLRDEIARLKKANPGKKITYDFIKSSKYPNGYVIRIDGKIQEQVSEGEDHEVSMAHNSLKSIVSSASQLMNMLGQDEKDIPAWIQDHITNAENFITQASKNYHEYNEGTTGEYDMDELPDGTIEEPAGDAEDLDMTLQSMMEDLLKTKK